MSETCCHRSADHCATGVKITGSRCCPTCAHDPRATLTEVLAAHVRLPMMHSQGCSCGWHASLSHPDLHRAHLAERIEEHIAARLAPIRALAEVWTYGYFPGAPSQRYAEALRAALDAPVSASQDHDGAEGQGEGWWSVPCCHGPVHNHPHKETR